MAKWVPSSRILNALTLCRVPDTRENLCCKSSVPNVTDRADMKSVSVTISHREGGTLARLEKGKAFSHFSRRRERRCQFMRRHEDSDERRSKEAGQSGPKPDQH